MDKISHVIEEIQSYPINKEKNNGLIAGGPLVLAFGAQVGLIKNFQLVFKQASVDIGTLASLMIKMKFIVVFAGMFWSSCGLLLLINPNFNWRRLIAVAGIMHLWTIRQDSQNIAFGPKFNKAARLYCCLGYTC